MSVKVKFKDKEVELDFSEQDIEKQTASFIGKKNVQGAIANLDKKGRMIEEARMLARQKLAQIQENLRDPRVEFKFRELEEERDDLQNDLAAIERLDNKIGSMVYKIRLVEKQRPELAARTETEELPPGAYAKMIRKQEEEQEILFCDNPECPGKDKTIKIGQKIEHCPFCGNKLKYIGKKTKD